MRFSNGIVYREEMTPIITSKYIQSLAELTGIDTKALASCGCQDCTIIHDFRKSSLHEADKAKLEKVASFLKEHDHVKLNSIYYDKEFKISNERDAYLALATYRSGADFQESVILVI